MGLRPTHVDEKRLGPATTFYRTVALSFVIPTEAYPDFLLRGTPQLPRMRLSLKESRMEFTGATKVNRKSGGA